VYLFFGEMKKPHTSRFENDCFEVIIPSTLYRFACI